MNQYEKLTWIYRSVLRLFPSPFRREFADEMAALFQEQLHEASIHGRLPLLIFFLRELFGLLVGGIRQQLYVRRARPLLVAYAGGGVAELIGRHIPWRKIILLVACLLPLLPVVIYLAGLSTMRASENRRMVNHVVLADFDGDGRQDALIILNRLERDHPPDRLLLNEGDGRFAASDLWPEIGYAQSAAAGDLTGNGRMDVAVAYTFGGLARVLNDDSGTLIRFGVVPQNSGYSSKAVALGDLDGDGRLDAFVTGCCPGGQVWLNRGDGLLVSSQQRLGPALSQAAALADLNGDGSLDVFVVHGNNWPYIIWWNSGHGRFNDGQTVGQIGDFALTDSSQTFGTAGGFAVVLGDVNGDGFPDAVVGRKGADEIWLNDGQGHFTLSQRFGRGFTHAIFLADLDGDSDLDIVAGGNSSARIWLNDGAGEFSQGQRIRYGRGAAFTLGDVTGDGIVDIFVARVELYQVWRGEGNGRFITGSE
ncbi:MAG: VCBS repeat-containing protein [Anaerolineae bacterium]|nr:VCBS repeat-containing protein [Anaerolineae bacterium]